MKSQNSNNIYEQLIEHNDQLIENMTTDVEQESLLIFCYVCHESMVDYTSTKPCSVLDKVYMRL